MVFHPPLILFLSVGFGGMAVAALLAFALDRIDSAFAARRTRERAYVGIRAGIASRHPTH